MGVLKSTSGGVLVVALNVLLVSGNVNMFGTGNQQQFAGSDCTSEVFDVDNREVFPVAYFDINADKLTDLLTVSRDRTSVNVFLAYDKPPFLRRALDSHKVTTEVDDHKGHKIISVRPGDFTGDGHVDLMVTLGKMKHNFTEFTIGNETRVTVVFCRVRYRSLDGGEGPLIKLECPGGGTGDTITNLVQEPMTLDLNGDMVLDLLGESWVANGTSYLKQRMVWLSDGLKEAFQWKTDNGFHLLGEQYQISDMLNISSNAFSDIDGDSIPELMILTENVTARRDTSVFFLETFEIVKDKDDRTSFRFKKPPHLLETYLNHTQILGQPMIIDLEHNGKLVHLTPFCTDLQCKTFGIYGINEGKAVPLPLGSFVYDGDPWSFIPPQSPPSPTPPPTTTTASPPSSPKSKSHHHHNRTTPAPPSEEDYRMELFYSQTIVLRVGDFNLDGYPDLLGVLMKSKRYSDRLSRAVLFENVPCSPTPEKPCHYSRTFAPNFDIFKEYQNVISASFYDIEENGVLDVILVVEDPSEGGYQYQRFLTKAVKNEMNFDSSFLKVMVLTGQQCLDCESEIPYGNVLPGATVRYTSTNAKGETESGVVVQTYRTSHMPLDLPCEIFGIGQSPNFVDTLMVTVAPNADEVYSKEWLQIIPNSQIVVMPSPVQRPGRWIMKLFLTPSGAVLNTFGVLVGICAVLATLGSALEYKERREDRKARQSEAHRLVMY